VIGDLTAEPVLPLGSESGVVLESGGCPSGGLRKRLANFLVGKVAEPTESRGRKEFDAGLAPVNVGSSALDRSYASRLDEVGEVVIKE